MKVYIVFGETGVYDDHQEWVAACYLDKRKARRFMRKAKKHIDKLFSENNHDWLKVRHLPNVAKYDPNISLDREGVNYNLSDYELRDSPDVKAPAKTEPASSLLPVKIGAPNEQPKNS